MCQADPETEAPTVSREGAHHFDPEKKAKEIALLWWKKGNPLPTLASDIAAALREVAGDRAADAATIADLSDQLARAQRLIVDYDVAYRARGDAK